MKTAPFAAFEPTNVLGKAKKIKETSTSIKGILRSQKGDKKGIYIRVTINREQEYFSTGYYVLPHEFSSEAGFVKNRAKNSEEINSYILHLCKELDNTLSNLKKSGEPVSVKNFQKFYERRFKMDLSFEDFFEKAIHNKKAGIEPSTLELYYRLPKKILEFRKDIALREIDKAFIRDWEQWLIKIGLCKNTISRYLKTLRTFLIIAEEDGYIDENPFEKIKIPEIVGERDYLTEEELNAFMEAEIPETNKGELRAREMFVFCCLTGIRYSDLINLKWSHFRTSSCDLYFQMQKTKTFVNIPLVAKAKEILGQQDRNSENVFKSITNQKLNEHLHSIEKRAKIQKKITVHVARHTFATLALEKGMVLEVVSKILGHSSIKMTMVYARITQKRIKDEMQKMNGLANQLNKNLNSTNPGDINQMIFKLQEIMAKMEAWGNHGSNEMRRAG